MYSGLVLSITIVHNYYFHNNGSPYSLLLSVGICSFRSGCQCDVCWAPLVGRTVGFSSMQWWACRWSSPGGFMRQINPCQGLSSSFSLPTSNILPSVRLDEHYDPSLILTWLLHSSWVPGTYSSLEENMPSPQLLQYLPAQSLGGREQLFMCVKLEWLRRHQEGCRIFASWTEKAWDLPLTEGWFSETICFYK